MSYRKRISGPGQTQKKRQPPTGATKKKEMGKTPRGQEVTTSPSEASPRTKIGAKKANLRPPSGAKEKSITKRTIIHYKDARTSFGTKAEIKKVHKDLTSQAKKLPEGQTKKAVNRKLKLANTEIVSADKTFSTNEHIELMDHANKLLREAEKLILKQEAQAQTPDKTKKVTEKPVEDPNIAKGKSRDNLNRARESFRKLKKTVVKLQTQAEQKGLSKTPGSGGDLNVLLADINEQLEKLSDKKINTLIENEQTCKTTSDKIWIKKRALDSQLAPIQNKIKSTPTPTPAANLSPATRKYAEKLAEKFIKPKTETGADRRRDLPNEPKTQQPAQKTFWQALFSFDLKAAWKALFG